MSSNSFEIFSVFFRNLIHELHPILFSSGLYFEILLITLSFFVAYLLSDFFNKKIDKNPSNSANLALKSASKNQLKSTSPSSKSKPNRLFDWISKNLESYFSALFLPFAALIFLSLTQLIYSSFFKNLIILAAAVKLAAIFFAYRLFYLWSHDSPIAKIFGLIMLPTSVLYFFGVLAPFLEYLDDFDFKIGKARISVYLIIKAIVVILLVFWLANLLSKKGKSYIDSKRSIKPSTKGIINKISDILIYCTAVIVVLKTFGVDLTTFAVIGGAVGVGIGLGLQKIASNFISGVILLFEKSVEVGDIVEIDNGQIYGTIKHFSGRFTLVEATDGKEVLIPNEEFITQRVINWTHSNRRARIEIDVSVAYSTNLKQAKEIMIKCASNHRRCLINPEVECFVVNFGDSGISLKLYFWVADVVEGRFGPKSDVMIAIHEEFARQGIVIPFPQREIKILGNQS